MSDIAVRVDSVSKKFSKDIRHMMMYGVQDISKNVFGIQAPTESLRKSEFWAVDGVSFELKKGQALGIIGPNGSGKTTMLKMLNGIFMPDRGAIDISGNVGALIQVGAGFHPMLTGRENVYVNGAVLGMTKKEIDRKFDSIVDFADIGDFLDMPVKHYSSGMFVRLGFSVAIHCEPDILLVDEILAVGDVNFRKKCAVRMKELEESDVTIILVTHDLGQLRHICDSAICLRSGKVVHHGDLDGAITEYMASPAEMKYAEEAGASDHKIKDVVVLGPDGGPVEELETGGRYIIRATLDMDKRVDHPVFGLAVYDGMGNTAIAFNTRNSGYRIDQLSGGETVSLELPFLNLIPGHYRVRAALYNSSMFMLDDVKDACVFMVRSKNYSTGAIFAEHRWSVAHGG